MMLQHRRQFLFRDRDQLQDLNVIFMKKRTLFSICLSLLFSGNIILFSQPKVEKKVVIEVKKDLLEPELKFKLTQFLVETNRMSFNLYSSENRISLILKSANLYWKINETESRVMYKYGMEEIRKIVSQLDFEMNQLEKSSEYEFSHLSLRNEIWFKLNKINILTKSLAEFLLAHDPKLCYEFFQTLTNSITNEQIRKNFQNRVAILENQLILQIAEQNIDQAIKIAEKRFNERGFFKDAADLLNLAFTKKYQGTESFAKKLINSLKGFAALNDTNISTAQNLLARGNAILTSSQRNQSKAMPLFTQSQMQDLAELIDRYKSRTDNYANTSLQSIELIKKFAPSRAESLNKIIERNVNLQKQSKPVVVTPSATDTALNNKLNARFRFQQELSNLLNPIFSKTADSLKKNQAIQDAERLISVVTDKQFKFSMLIWLAKICVRANEKKLAISVLLEAEIMLPQHLKSSVDFSMAWILADTFGLADSIKSIEIVEKAMLDLNAVINGYAVFTEYMGGEILVEDGEIKVESGNSTKTLGLEILKGSLIKKLAERDFERVSLLADRIDRTEFRIEIRLLIARSLLYPPIIEREMSLEF